MSTEPYNCTEELKKLWDVYNQIIADPNRVVRVRKDGREVEYGGVHLKHIEQLYMTHWNNCKDKGGLPPIGANNHIQRGCAARARFS